MSNENNIFAKIITGEIPCHKVYEDDKVLAFLDIHPVNKGHTLIIPKKHAVNIFDIGEEEIVEMIKVARRLARLIRDVVQADGMNIHMNNEKAGGQAVFHAHIHIIPRHEGDGFTHWPSREGYAEGEAEELIKEIISKIN
ncbi:MAG: HIT family protein [Candidatus Paceibacterota bacterium]